MRTWAAVLVGIVCMCTSTAPVFSESGATGELLLDMLTALDKAQPADSSKVEEIFGQSIGCPPNGAGDCQKRDVTIGQVKMGRLEFRRRAAVRLLILHELSGSCLSIASIEERFGVGSLDNSCTDGHTCWYWGMTRPWGRLSFGVTESNSKCANSVVMNAPMK